ncbi:hypothetical protein L6452_33729 [Arctium lappa]|uniref:Uncharacterized protein n=1 Tax=Arctium lappa TaxID=4217 RepID=A0ACB8YKE5_ARCLA|nr:hypothetical protein L6452_33729 [Arctium lappa]
MSPITTTQLLYKEDFYRIHCNLVHYESRYLCSLRFSVTVHDLLFDSYRKEGFQVLRLRFLCFILTPPRLCNNRSSKSRHI